MKIKNFGILAKNSARKTALKIIETGLEAVDTNFVVKANIRIKGDSLVVKSQKFNLAGSKRIFVIGVGKCALEAAGALEEILGRRISGGLVIDVHPGKLKRIKTFTGSHPFPSNKNVKASQELVSLLKPLKNSDLVIAVISGGGSTLLCLPQDLTCRQEAKILKCLFQQGATIKEINTLRKHLSLLRGGFLLLHAWPAKVISLIFSDVPGDDINFISSGPTIKDKTTIADAKKIIEKYQVEKKCAIRDINLIETPKEKKFFQNVKNILLVSNKTATQAMFSQAKKSGLKPTIKNLKFGGEAKVLAKKFIAELGKVKNRSALIFGGESTVKVKGKGQGGRNQEMALAGLGSIKKGEVLITIASDGRDNSNHAGAICDIITKEKAKKLGLKISKFLKNNDSYNFFKKTGDYIFTGETGSNVSDLVLAIKSE